MHHKADRNSVNFCQLISFLCDELTAPTAPVFMFIGANLRMKMNSRRAGRGLDGCFRGLLQSDRRAHAGIGGSGTPQEHLD